MWFIGAAAGAALDSMLGDIPGFLGWMAHRLLRDLGKAPGDPKNP